MKTSERRLTDNKKPHIWFTGSFWKVNLCAEKSSTNPKLIAGINREALDFAHYKFIKSLGSK